MDFPGHPWTCLDLLGLDWTVLDLPRQKKQLLTWLLENVQSLTKTCHGTQGTKEPPQKTHSPLGSLNPLQPPGALG